MENSKKKLEFEKKIVLICRVKAGASKTELLSEMADGSLKIALKALPEKGQANSELIRYLTKKFRVLRENVKIINGKRSPYKVVKIVR